MSDTKVSSTGLGRLQWRMVLFLFILAAAFGFIGEAVETPWPDPAFSPAWFRALSDDLFLTLLYFTFSAPVDAAGSNSILHIARFLAPLATISAIIKIAIETLYTTWLQARTKTLQGHVVVVGFGSLGQQIARQFLQEGTRTVVLDLQPTSDASELAAQLGIPLFVGDATHAADLARVSAQRAATIFFVTDNDIINLEACAAASALMSQTDKARTHLLVHLGDPELSHQLQDYERRIAFIGDKRTAVSFFNLNDLLARQLLGENPIYMTAYKLCQTRLHMVVIGLNDISRKIISHTLLSQRTHHLDRPHFTILDPAASEERKTFEAIWPGLADVATMDFVDTPLAPARIEKLVRKAGKTAPVTATALCLPNETENLTIALKLHAAAARGQIHAGHIMVRRDHTSDFFERLSRLERFDFANMLIDFGEGDHQLFVRQITGEDDALARRFHRAYCDERAAAGDAPSASTSPWEVLPESGRRANRRAADFIWTKLRAVGYRIEHDARALPRLLDNAARLQTPATAEALARLEHERWWADRALDGWSRGPVRDNEALIHPDMRPFDELSATTQDKDREQNSFIVNLLRQIASAGGAATPVPVECTIGLEFDTAAPPQEPEACAAALKAQFPNQAFVVLCQARTPAQTAWMNTLVAELATKDHEAHLLRLFTAGQDKALETPDAQDETLWLNLKAAGATTKKGYPVGMTCQEYLAARADHRLTVAVSAH